MVLNSLRHLHLDSIEALRDNYDTQAVLSQLKTSNASKKDVTLAKKALNKTTVVAWMKKQAAGKPGERRRTVEITRTGLHQRLGINFEPHPGVLVGDVGDIGPSPALGLLYASDRILAINGSRLDDKDPRECGPIVEAALDTTELVLAVANRDMDADEHEVKVTRASTEVDWELTFHFELLVVRLLWRALLQAFYQDCYYLTVLLTATCVFLCIKIGKMLRVWGRI